MPPVFSARFKMIPNSLFDLRIKMDTLSILSLTFCYVITILLLHSSVVRYKKRSREDAVDKRGPNFHDLLSLAPEQTKDVLPKNLSPMN